MYVLAVKTINESNRWLHWEILRETCISFNFELVEYNPLNPIIEPVCLSALHGIPLNLIKWPQLPTIILGCDDNNEPDQYPRNATVVNIPTPVNYFLWSPVALGIALYDYHKQWGTK